RVRSSSSPSAVPTTMSNPLTSNNPPILILLEDNINIQRFKDFKKRKRKDSEMREPRQSISKGRNSRMSDGKG
ncbi:hypothetical protein U1Q18_005487, partial [Sarracenia purpurea var. burkii]